MVVDILRLLPPWMVLGVALGALATLFVAAIFYLGDRLLPTARPTVAGRVDGGARRRDEIRDYLRDIDERFHEEHAIGDVTVDFYLPDRDVAITFDAHAYFRLDGTDTFTVLCEHEMPGRGLGKRLPFDVPTVESAAADAPDPVVAAFDELGLARSANESEVKSAYRERIKEVHPDQGGDEAAFRRVREAYATARNHCKRRERARRGAVQNERVREEFR